MSDRLTTGPQPGIALAVRSVSKTWGATRALRDVSFEVGKGELHALVGGNGSGKSTMVKILAGVVASDPGGSVTVFGREVDANAITPHLARAAGLHFVHQDPAVFPDMTVADNLFLGGPFPTARAGHISRRGQRRAALEVLSRFDVQVSPDDLMAGLSASKRTMVAIARALKDQEEAHSGILVLDVLGLRVRLDDLISRPWLDQQFRPGLCLADAGHHRRIQRRRLGFGCLEEPTRALPQGRSHQGPDRLRRR